MADNNIELRVSVKGNNDLKEMTNLLKNAETNLSSLAQIDKAGQVTAQARNKLIKQTATELKALGYTQKQAETAALDYYNKIRQGLDSTAKADKLAHDEWAKRQRYRLTLMQNSAKADKLAHDEWAKRQRYRITLMKNSAKMEADLQAKKRRANQAALQDLQKQESQRQRQIASIQRLKGAVDPMYAATKKLEKVEEELNAAVRAGIITRQQAASTLSQYKAQLNTITASQMAATKGANRMGVVTQQAGYQVSDFIVQIQSGTNPFVAFSQQASQLAGVLPLVANQIGLTAKAAIAWSAGLGIAIPVIGLIGAAWLKYREEQKGAEGALKDFNSALDASMSTLDSYKETLEKLTDEDLAETFGNYSEQTRQLAETVKDLELTMAGVELGVAFTKLTSDIDDSITRLEEYKRLAQVAANLIQMSFGQALGANALDGFIYKEPTRRLEEMGLSGVDPGEFTKIQELMDAGSFEEAGQRISAVIKQAIDSGNTLGYQTQKLLLDLRNSADRAMMQAAELDGSAQQARDDAKAAKVSDEERAALQAKIVAKKAELLQVETAFGKQSTVSLEIAKQLAALEIQRSNLGKDVSTDTYNNQLRAAYSLLDAQRLSQVTEDQRVAAANKVLQAKTELTRVEAEYGKLSQEAQDAAVAVAMAELERSNLGKTINAELAEQQKKATAQGVIQEYLSDREIDSLKRQKDKTDFLDKQNYKYTQLALAEEKGGDAAVEASRRAKEEIALRNAALSAGLDITGADYLNLIKSLRTYQDIRQANEDIISAKELSEKTSKAIQAAEDKVAQEQIKTLKAQGDITKARELEVNLAKRMAYEKVLSSAKTEEEKQELMASAIEAAVLAEELVKAGHATEDAKDEAKELANALKDAEQAMSSLTSFGDGLEKKLAQAKAEAVALKLGLDVGTAKDVAGLRFEAAKEYESAFTTATDSAGQVSAALEYGRALELINDLEEAGYDNAAKRDSQKDKNIKSTQDEIDKLMEAIRVEETRLNLGEEEARQLEILQDLRRFNADADVKLKDDQMKAAAAQIAQMEQTNQKLEEQKQMYEDLGDSIADHFGDAILSIVDGTETMEDAFRKMAAAIVQDLFRILVLEQAIAAFKLAGKAMGIPFLNADGNAFSNGRVTPYADGGVVSSPTYFPMAGGNTGLMGEAGPEAIMPLKRGKDGKLGVQAEGGGNVVVNQTINVSTGVQQTVRTEIKSLMPQIADSAKNAVLDSKRRGGSYGRNF